MTVSSNQRSESRQHVNKATSRALVKTLPGPNDICFPELTVPPYKVFIPRQDYNAGRDSLMFSNPVDIIVLI